QRHSDCDKAGAGSHDGSAPLAPIGGATSMPTQSDRRTPIHLSAARPSTNGFLAGIRIDSQADKQADFLV
ncbi:MAG TPA: hypothetical protein VGG24_19440, partial [Paraburkholderia sp.]